jgi:predicted O-linked N-acetylglucosamine transferase (SPINDLY family)
MTDPPADPALRAAVDRLMHEPADTGALRMLGLLAHRAGRLDASVEIARLAANPPVERADAYAHLGNVLRKLGQPSAAVDSFRRALDARWNFPEVLCDLGNTLAEASRTDEAVLCYRTALNLRPHDPIVHANLGSALRTLGQLDAAIENFRAALALDPTRAPTHLNLANALLELDDLDGAIAASAAAVTHQPTDAGLRRILAARLASAGRVRDAIDEYRRALALDPADAVAHFELGSLLLTLGDWSAVAEHFATACALAPRDATLRSNVVFGLNYDPEIDDAALFEAHRDFDRDVTAPLRPTVPSHGNSRDPERPLRVGYVSADLCRHPVGYLFAPVLAAHDPSAVQVVCYAGNVHKDDLTDALRGRSHGWHSTVGLDDAAVVERIRADGIDILVDLAGHTGGNRLTVFARNPAPVQVSWLGYFNTTGMTAIDYVVMGATCVLPESERFFTERVARLPAGRFCYQPPDYAPPVVEPPARAAGRVTFGSFNNLGKLNDGVCELWAAVLCAVPGSQLLLKWHLRHPEQAEHWRAAFAARGIDPERVILRGASPHVQMLAEYGDVDIALDPFPFCGGLTSCEALWMGVPIVTLRGRRTVSRQTLGLLSQLGLTQLVADSPQHYVELASALAADLPALAAMRAGLRLRMAASPLCDAGSFTRGLEAAYRAMWRAWCVDGWPGGVRFL